MEQFIIKKWEQRKDLLSNIISSTDQSDIDYLFLVKLIVAHVISDEEDEWDSLNVQEIDNGNYQGTLMFIIHRAMYQPSAEDYLVTYSYYGSCSGCDTIEGIRCYEDGKPTLNQIDQYMTLCLHLVQRMKFIYNQNND